MPAPVVASLSEQWRAVGAIGLFADGAEPGAALSQARLRELSPLYAALFGRFLASFSSALASRWGRPEKAAAVLGRACLVPLLHCWFDRFLRLDALLRSRPAGRRLAVVEAQADPPSDAAELWSMAHGSTRFNQALLARLAPVLGLETAAAIVPLEPPETEPPGGPAAQAAPGFDLAAASLPRRLARRLSGAVKGAVFRRLAGRQGPVPVLSMGRSTDAFQAAGFYPHLMEDIQGRVAFQDAPREDSMRFMLTVLAHSGGHAVAEFLAGAGVACEGVGDPQAPAKAVSGLGGWLAWAYPTILLEAIPGNLSDCIEVLRPFAPKPLLVAEASTLEPIYMMAAARCLGMEVIRIQHGGHRGYTDDHLWAAEMEYACADRYASWGWETMPPFDSCRSVRAVPLPAPWLEERRAAWRGALPPLADRAEPKPFDFLLTTSELYRYPPAPGSSTAPHSGCLPEIAAALEGLVEDCAAQGASILHRTADRRSALLMASTLPELGRLGGERYRGAEHPGKGLTPALLARCHIVLWDQPGTGFLECLDGGVPSMAYWRRLFSREDDDALPFMRELEDAGIIHRETSTLLRSLAAFKSGPRGWMAEPKRAQAVRRFCRRYAWAEDDWPAHWRNFLNGLACDRHADP
ncbi:MAG: hypothetical protein HY927_15245 [Elusimicrobia bacterium]|nr:hypothetical protein [Elusimicrobiota bacterium]